MRQPDRQNEGLQKRRNTHFYGWIIDKWHMGFCVISWQPSLSGVKLMSDELMTYMQNIHKCKLSNTEIERETLWERTTQQFRLIDHILLNYQTKLECLWYHIERCLLHLQIWDWSKRKNCSTINTSGKVINTHISWLVFRQDWRKIRCISESKLRLKIPKSACSVLICFVILSKQSSENGFEAKRERKKKKT